MSGPKIFIAVLFLIGILFVVGINLGATHSDDLTFQTPAWLTGLGGALASPQPLKIADLSPTSASCPLQGGSFFVPMGKTCRFAITQSFFAQRVVALQLVHGSSAMVTVYQEEMLPVQQSLTGAGAMTNADMKTADLKVYPGKAHGMLYIQCSDVAHTCQLKLKT